MKRIIRNIAFQSLLMLLVVQTLNLSINSVDFYTVNVSAASDDLDYIDSMVEYIVENVMGNSTDTIHDKASMDNSSKQQQTPVHFDLKWFPNDAVISQLAEVINDAAGIRVQNEQLINLYYKEVPVKPPQV
jgi:hypothetical protein